MTALCRTFSSYYRSTRILTVSLLVIMNLYEISHFGLLYIASINSNYILLGA